MPASVEPVTEQTTIVSKKMRPPRDTREVSCRGFGYDQPDRTASFC
jgi:hypothetical protein